MVVHYMSRLWLCVALLTIELAVVSGDDAPFGSRPRIAAGIQTPATRPLAIPYPDSDGIPDRPRYPPLPLVRSMAPAETFADSLDREPGAGGPAGEFVTQQALLLAWIPHNKNAQPVQVEIIRLVSPTTHVILIVPDESGIKDVENVLDDHGVSTDNVTILASPVDTPWIRDYGPFSVRNQTGCVELIDSPYGDDRALDDGLPVRLAAHLEMPSVETRLIVEGGNLLTNGDGLLVCSTRMVGDNQGQGFTLKEIRQKLLREWHVREAVFVDPIAGEPTGHVDMLMTFPSEETVIIGQYDADSPDVFNRDLLNNTADQMASIRLPGGKYLQVERIPMPYQQEAEFWPTYCNVIYANGVLLVPFYKEQDESYERAAEVYRRVLPGWRIAGIDCSEIIRTGGALHCLSTTIPADGQLNHKPLFRGRRVVAVPPTRSGQDRILNRFLESR